MSFPYVNPTNSSRLSAPWSVGRSTVEGTNFSVLGIGGWMEVANLSDLSLTFIGTGSQTYSGNSVPINISIGKGTPFSPNALQLHNDNISSGRRRIGMVVYVNETGLSYQYEIDNYETLWSAATASEGTVLINTYNTSVYSNSVAGQNFINAWTGSTIEGVSGTTRDNARWRIFHGTDTFITGGTYFSGTSTIELYRNDGETIPITGVGNTVQNPASTRVLTSDGTTQGAIAQSGLTYDGNSLIIYGNQLIESQSGSSISTTGVTITSIPKSTGSSAHFEYVITNGSGYMRAGTIMAAWDGTSATFNDTSTPDLNGSTLGFVFDVSIIGSNLLLKANVTSGTWMVKIGTRVIF